MSDAKSHVSPIVAIASVAVIIFSVVGVGVMTGWIPSSRSTVKEIEQPQAQTGQSQGMPSSPTVSHDSSASPKVKKAPAHVASSNESVREQPVASAPVEPVPSTPVPVAAPPLCHDCGVIDAINVAEQKGQGSGLGAAGGAVVGGLLGHQVGNGRGNTVATIAGAVGGAFAGNEVEKRVKSNKQYSVSVRMDDGNFKSFTFDIQPAYTVGEKVKVVDGKLIRG